MSGSGEWVPPEADGALTDGGESPPPVSSDQEELHAAYLAERRSLCRRSVRALCAIGVLLIAAFAPFDYLRHPQATFFSVSLPLRLGNMMLLALIFWFLRLPARGRLAPPLCLAASVGIGVMLYGMMLRTGGIDSRYSFGFNMLLLTVPVLITWGVEWSAALCTTLVGGYFAATFVLVPDADAAKLADQLSIFLGTTVLAVTVTALRERLRWREFVTRWTVAQAYHRKSAFFANMSHELRTPLHVIVGYVDMLVDGAADMAREEGRQMLERIRGEGMLLHRLVSDLLDFAKVEAGKMEVSLEPVRLSELLEDVAASFRLLAAQKQLSLETECPDEVSIVSDRHKLRQILNNLVGNAIKFTRSGRVKIEARPLGRNGAHAWHDLVFLDGVNTHVTPVERPTRGVALAISDTGVGIQAADLRRLAVDFQQVNGAVAAMTERGTGLGLSLSRKLVALLGGRIAVRSAYGHGSTFVVLLPERPPPATTGQTHP